MSIRDMLREWLVEPEFLTSETFVIEPGTSIDMDTFEYVPGSYTVYIDLTNIIHAHVLSIQAYIRPEPGADEILYLTASPKKNNESLWMAKIPPCAGFRINYMLDSGKDLKLKTSVWK